MNSEAGDNEQHAPSVYSRYIGVTFLIGIIIPATAFLISTVYTGYAGAFWVAKTSNTEALRHVFYSGKPHLVVCRTLYKNKLSVVPQVFKDAAFWLYPSVTMTSINCQGKLSSGKTISEKFKLPTNTVAFVTSRRQPPVPISPSAMGTAASIITMVNKAIAPSIAVYRKKADLVACIKNARNCVSFTPRGSPVEYIWKIAVKNSAARFYQTGNLMISTTKTDNDARFEEFKRVKYPDSDLSMMMTCWARNDMDRTFSRSTWIQPQETLKVYLFMWRCWWWNAASAENNLFSESNKTGEWLMWSDSQLDFPAVPKPIVTSQPSTIEPDLNSIEIEL